MAKEPKHDVTYNEAMDKAESDIRIWAIIAQLRFEAKDRNKAFNEGDTFFSLCFKSDDELLTIARLSGV